MSYYFKNILKYFNFIMNKKNFPFIIKYLYIRAFIHFKNKSYYLIN